jgi:hypothetical protein
MVTAGTNAAMNALTLGVPGAAERTIAKKARTLTAGVKSGAVNEEQGAAQLAKIEAKQAANNARQEDCTGCCRHDRRDGGRGCERSSRSEAGVRSCRRDGCGR